MICGIVIVAYHRQGGHERRTTELAKGLLAAGHQVHLFAHRWDPELTRDLICHRVPMLKLASWTKPLSFALAADRAIRGMSLDVVHSEARTLVDSQVSVAGGSQQAYLEQMLSSYPPFYRMYLRHHPFHLVTLALEREQYRRSRRIIAISHRSRSGLLSYYPWAKKKTVVIHNGVDSKEFDPTANAPLRLPTRRKLGLEEDDIVYLFVGTGFVRKGLRQAILALSRVAREQQAPNVKLLVAGAGDTGRYQELAGKSGVGDRVLLLGRVPDPRLCYAASDIFVLPTKYEPFGNTILEAMASGLPPITTRAAGASELLTSGENALVIEEAGDVSSLAKAMRDLLSSKRREIMGRKARLTAEEYPWSKTVNSYIELYREVIREKELEGPVGHDRSPRA